MKSHTTVTITKRFLERAAACTSGLKAVAKYLPAKISTDPEENIELSIALDSARGTVGWLVSAITDRCFCGTCINPSRGHNHDDPYVVDDDPYVVAQGLAWVADVIATGEGR